MMLTPVLEMLYCQNILHCSCFVLRHVVNFMSTAGISHVTRRMQIKRPRVQKHVEKNWENDRRNSPNFPFQRYTLFSSLLLHTLWRSEVYWRPGATSNHDAHSLFTYQNKGYLHTTGEFVTIPTNLSAKPPPPPMLPYIPDKQ